MTARDGSTVGLIWAQASNGVIGRNGTMPWHLPEDFEHFRHTTSGHPVIMGRRTWESLPERFRPLPGRKNIVITSDPIWSAPGTQRSSSILNALAAVAGQPGSDQIWIIGGGLVYREALFLGVANTAVITVVKGAPFMDTASMAKCLSSVAGPMRMPLCEAPYTPSDRLLLGGPFKSIRHGLMPVHTHIAPAGITCRLPSETIATRLRPCAGCNPVWPR